MTNIRFECPHCQQHFEAPPYMAGTTIECLTCGKSITVPDVPTIDAKGQPSEHKPSAAPESARTETGRCHSPPLTESVRKKAHAARWYASCRVVVLCGIALILYVTCPPFAVISAITVLVFLSLQLQRDKKARDTSKYGPAPIWMWRTIVVATLSGIVALASAWVPAISFVSSVVAAVLGAFCIVAARGYRRCGLCVLLLAYIATLPYVIRQDVPQRVDKASPRAAARSEPEPPERDPYEPTVNIESVEASIDAMAAHLRRNNRDDELAWLNVAIAEMIRRGEVDAAGIRGLTASELIAYTGVRQSGKTARETFQDIADQVAAERRTKQEAQPEEKSPGRVRKFWQNHKGKIIAGAVVAGTATAAYLLSKGSVAAPSRAPNLESMADRRPINYKYAGQRHPSGVYFDRSGHPDFSPYAKTSVQIKGLAGDNRFDAPRANAAAGYNNTPAGFTWHHHQNGTTMQLVPTDIHEAARHTGGASFIRNRDQ